MIRIGTPKLKAETVAKLFGGTKGKRKEISNKKATIELIAKMILSQNFNPFTEFNLFRL